jgi:hypothetical protein
MKMNDNEILDALNWALDAMDEGRTADAKDYVQQVRDEYDARQDAADEALMEAVYEDARDHHLINQNFNRAFGVKK